MKIGLGVQLPDLATTPGSSRPGGSVKPPAPSVVIKDFLSSKVSAKDVEFACELLLDITYYYYSVDDAPLSARDVVYTDPEGTIPLINPGGYSKFRDGNNIGYYQIRDRDSMILSIGPC